MEKKEIETEINKLFVKHAIRNNRPLPEALYDDIFNIITKAIQVQAKVIVKTAEWISIDKRLPKRGQQVIWYHPEIKDDKNGLAEYIRVDFADLPNRRASHWMPLPEPPK